MRAMTKERDAYTSDPSNQHFFNILRLSLARFMLSSITSPYLATNLATTNITLMMSQWKWFGLGNVLLSDVAEFSNKLSYSILFFFFIIGVWIVIPLLLYKSYLHSNACKILSSQ